MRRPTSSSLNEEVLRRAFYRNDDGSWTCKEPSTLHPPAGRIRVKPGSRFYPGTTFMTFDIASWLETRLADTAERCDSEPSAQQNQPTDLRSSDPLQGTHRLQRKRRAVSFGITGPPLARGPGG